MHGVEASHGVRYAYRRHGGGDGPPLLCLSHFRASVDMWDPGLVERIAANREVILFDSAGVGRSTGSAPSSVGGMAEHVLAFADALGLAHADLLGFSLGGYVAQEVALRRPQFARRLVLAGTAPPGTGSDLALTGKTHATATKESLGPKDLLRLFFPPTEAGRDSGIAFIRRLGQRRPDPDLGVRTETWRAQLEAARAWGAPDPGAVERLARLDLPVLIAHGAQDVMVGVDKAWLLAQRLPGAELKVFPDAGHGFLFQHYTEFADDITRFLSALGQAPREADRQTGVRAQ